MPTMPTMPVGAAHLNSNERVTNALVLTSVAAVMQQYSLNTRNGIVTAPLVDRRRMCGPRPCYAPPPTAVPLRGWRRTAHAAYL